MIKDNTFILQISNDFHKRQLISHILYKKHLKYKYICMH